MLLRVRTLRRKLMLAITVAVMLIAALNLMTDNSENNQGDVQDFPVLQRQRSIVTNVKELLQLANNKTDIYPLMSIYDHYHQIIKSSLGDMEEEYQEHPYTHVLHEDRKRHLERKCEDLKANSSGFNATLLSLWYMQDADMLYCPVPKVGTTFWRRVLNVILLKDSKFNSPFQFSFGDLNQFERGVHVDLKKELPHSSLSVLFTRDPYKRLFSAYVDKMLSPNIYLRGLGKDIIRRFRPNPSNESVHCGHDVTFDEFIDHIITTKARSLNEHFRPVHMLCDVCNLHYDIIGKLETFKQDSMFLLNRLGVLGQTVKFQNSKIEQSVDVVVDLAVRIFTQRKQLEKCMTFHVALVRMWRHLQIVGVISKSKPFPLMPKQSESIKILEIVNTVLEAYISSNDAKSNKQEAFVMAYQQISQSNMEKLRAKFQLDFTLFDYDDRPAKLFDKTQMRNFEFDYFDVLKE